MVFLVLDLEEVPVDQVVEEGLGDGFVLMQGGELEGSYPNVRACYAGQDCPGQFVFSQNLFPSSNDCKAATGCWDPECMHGFADDIFPKHRSECDPSVASTGIGSSP